MLINIPRVVLLEIQSVLDTFIWGGKKPRIKVKQLYQLIEQVGLAVPEMRRHYDASQTAALLSWWQTSQEIYRGCEQSGVAILLSDWVMLDKDTHQRLASTNRIRASIIAVWACLQDNLAPSQSLLVSFLTHPGFRAAMQSSNFILWHQKGILRM